MTIAYRSPSQANIKIKDIANRRKTNHQYWTISGRQPRRLTHRPFSNILYVLKARSDKGGGIWNR